MATLETKIDATSRSGRSLVQNIIAGVASLVLIAVAGAVTETVTPGAAVDWATLGAAVGTAALGALAAYVQRRLEGSAKDRR